MREKKECVTRRESKQIARAVQKHHLWGACAERRRCVDLQQPRLELFVDQDVEAVQREAVLIVDHDVLRRKQRANAHHLDLVEQRIDCVVPVLAVHVHLQGAHVPLAAGHLVVVLPALLDGDVGQVHHLIVGLRAVHGEARVREAREALPVHVDGQRLIRGAKHCRFGGEEERRMRNISRGRGSERRRDRGEEWGVVGVRGVFQQHTI